MTSRLFVFGVIGGLVAALGLAGLFSTLSTQSSAQMMQHQGTMTQQSPVSNTMYQNMFSAHGMSMVQDVQISGVTITGDNEVSVALNYVGNGTTPSVTLVAMTNHGSMMAMIGGGSMGGMTGSGMMVGNSSFTGQSQTGSSVIDGGWQSGSTVTMKLDGVGVSAYNAADLHICVFPHLT